MLSHDVNRKLVANGFLPDAPPAFIDGYPISYRDWDGDRFCELCARESDYEMISVDFALEGPITYCAACEIELPTAYGDPDTECEVAVDDCVECGEAASIFFGDAYVCVEHAPHPTLVDGLSIA